MCIHVLTCVHVCVYARVCVLGFDVKSLCVWNTEHLGSHWQGGALQTLGGRVRACGLCAA